MNSEVNNLNANVNKINFIDNFDTTQLINSLEKFEQAQTKTNAQPLINELQRMVDAEHDKEKPSANAGDKME